MHGAALAPLPHLLQACSAAAGAAHCSQETGTTKPNFLIPASAGCDSFGSNSKLHMAIHPNALQPRKGTHVAASPLPQEAFLSPFCSAQHLKACTLDVRCGLSTKGAISRDIPLFREIFLQRNFFQKYQPTDRPLDHKTAASASSSEASTVQVSTDKGSSNFDGHLTPLQPHGINQVSCGQHSLHTTSWRNKHTYLIFQVQPLPRS